MKPEYDFTQGKRGQFFRPNVGLRLPIYLEENVQTQLAQRAATKGIPLGELVNVLLKREIQTLDSIKK